MADNTPTLKVKDVLTIHSALQALNAGHVEYALDENGKVKLDENKQPVVLNRTPFSFTAKGRYAIAKNFARTSREAELVQKTRNDLINDVSGGAGEIKETDPEFKAKVEKVGKELDKLFDSPSGVTLHNISAADLNLDVNVNLPTEVVAALDLILVE